MVEEVKENEMEKMLKEDLEKQFSLLYEIKNNWEIEGENDENVKLTANL